LLRFFFSFSAGNFAANFRSVILAYGLYAYDFPSVVIHQNSLTEKPNYIFCGKLPLGHTGVRLYAHDFPSVVIHQNSLTEKPNYIFCG